MPACSESRRIETLLFQISFDYGNSISILAFIGHTLNVSRIYN